MNYKKMILVALIISVFVFGAVSTVSAKTTKATLKVSAPKVTNTYNASQTFKVTVKDKKTKKPVKKLKVNIKIYTGKKYKNYNLKTNKKGIVSINTKSLSKTKHKVIIKIKKTKKYKAITVKSVITIKPKKSTNPTINPTNTTNTDNKTPEVKTPKKTRIKTDFLVSYVYLYGQLSGISTTFYIYDEDNKRIDGLPIQVFEVDKPWQNITSGESATIYMNQGRTYYFKFLGNDDYLSSSYSYIL